MRPKKIEPDPNPERKVGIFFGHTDLTIADRGGSVYIFAREN